MGSDLEEDQDGGFTLLAAEVAILVLDSNQLLHFINIFRRVNNVADSN